MSHKVNLFTGLATALMAIAPALVAAETPAQATRREITKTFGFEPLFLKAVPDAALPGAWEQLKGLDMNPNTALPGKIKDLIGLAVASQIPSKGGIYSYTECAKLNGATQKEIGEAVTMAALARNWSTFMNGIQLDETKFRAELRALVDGAKKAAASGAAPPPPVMVVDARSALKDIEQSFGFVPEFIKKYPSAALPGAWKMMRDVEMSPTTALPGKYKSLIGLAVSSQIPCRYCIAADTEFSKLEGATDQEISEAVAMGGLVRSWAALIDGLQVDEAQSRREVDRFVKAARTAMASSKKTTALTNGSR